MEQQDRDRRRTLALVNLAAIMERADEALLPAVYREVGAALHATPAGLGALTLCRSLVQAACYPLAAYAAARHNRAHVIAAGTFLWAATTFLVGVSQTFVQPFRLDSTDDGTRGSAFGWLQLASSLGHVSGGLVGLLLAQTTVLGIAGWRVAFHLVAAISVAVGALNWFLAVDPHFSTSHDAGHRRDGRPVAKKQPATGRQVVREMIREAKLVVWIPTFQIFVAQGVSGSFPWSALSFEPMWLELIGFSHGDTAVLMTIFWVGRSLGGKMLRGLPDDPSTGVAYGAVPFVMGMFISWNGPATNFPIFAEIVPERSRTSIYALDKSLEAALSSFAPPIVGILAQRVYGYTPDDKGKSINQDRQNARSLAKALYVAIAVPFIVCASMYSFMYCSYPRDREHA
ncbi:hypothetical protein SETIT_2G189000v2 [Setaria italica]|uniref:Major facilitator superfamily (MFS) profile domain-containing protein n=1 Tax=Setaria italica TaxID=4555 RepID=A0A368Q0N5_SETIT|nr:hypothetical protein SETIT_2G189000v2 [Setaria italica]